MKLKLQNASIAANFGLPQKDCEYEDATALYTKDHPQITMTDAMNHVNAAIAAGVYTTDEKPGAAKPKPRGTIDLADGADDTEAALAARTLNARKEK